MEQISHQHRVAGFRFLAEDVLAVVAAWTPLQADQLAMAQVGDGCPIQVLDEVA
jgi:hypothetical protein